MTKMKKKVNETERAQYIRILQLETALQSVKKAATFALDNKELPSDVEWALKTIVTTVEGEEK